MNAKELARVVGTEPANDHEAAQADANQTMLRAAELAVGLGVNLDTFMAAALAAYLQANPAAREEIEAMQLMAELDELRSRGAVGSA